ncbi:VOC family protein [Kibdelosporangium aridum]|uniref:Lactoylglutathione lyase n=1 Tax=Kibdelosporangium aridum TaxID=2030 RepID=A0A1W2BMI6_KIBAR|nr:VOC family protein [Kibdelosporangium aridum]SMC74054.1 lactoylglutathione lyase [Kibdelosporangium aridum]
MEFSDPQVILFVSDTERAASFYGIFGFRETFRSPQEDPVKIEMALGGFTIGLALPRLLAESHGLEPVTAGHRACIAIWTDDVDTAYRLALSSGATDNRAPYAFGEGRFRIAFVEDPDGYPVQLVQKAG